LCGAILCRKKPGNEALENIIRSGAEIIIVPVLMYIFGFASIAVGEFVGFMGGTLNPYTVGIVLATVNAAGC